MIYIRGILEAGGNVNQHSNQDATPILIASLAGHTDVVRLPRSKFKKNKKIKKIYKKIIPLYKLIYVRLF